MPNPPETIEGKSVSFSPPDSVQERIESACCITDAALGGKSHSKSKICCVCGRHGLSDDDSKDNKWIINHLRNHCPGAADLARLLLAIESGEETGYVSASNMSRGLDRRSDELTSSFYFLAGGVLAPGIFPPAAWPAPQPEMQPLDVEPIIRCVSTLMGSTSMASNMVPSHANHALMITGSHTLHLLHAAQRRRGRPRTGGSWVWR